MESKRLAPEASSEANLTNLLPRKMGLSDHTGLSAESTRKPGLLSNEVEKALGKASGILNEDLEQARGLALRSDAKKRTFE